MCYLATLVLHVVPMNYVLAGSTYLAGLGVIEAVRGKPVDSHARIADLLRDWMPFALSVAITAGVAPILFVQILYKAPFYTANLLLFHRWMAILPVLIAAFYLLYVQKSKALANGRRWLRMGVSLAILGCFAFVAWSWTENHLLSTRGQEVWVAQYTSNSLFYGDPELPPRLAVWYLGAFANLAMVLAWQFVGLHRGRQEPVPSGPLAALALGGLAASAVATAIYAAALPSDIRATIGDQAWLYLLLAIAGGALQVTGWLQVWRGETLSRAAVGLLTAGALLATIAMTLVREVRRLATVDISAYYEAHARASEVGGLVLFVVFFVINAALIAAVGVLLHRGLRTKAP